MPAGALKGLAISRNKNQENLMGDYFNLIQNILEEWEASLIPLDIPEYQTSEEISEYEEF